MRALNAVLCSHAYYSHCACVNVRGLVNSIAAYFLLCVCMVIILTGLLDSMIADEWLTNSVIFYPLLQYTNHFLEEQN